MGGYFKKKQVKWNTFSTFFLYEPSMLFVCSVRCEYSGWTMTGIELGEEKIGNFTFDFLSRWTCDLIILHKLPIVSCICLCAHAQQSVLAHPCRAIEKRPHNIQSTLKHFFRIIKKSISHSKWWAMLSGCNAAGWCDPTNVSPSTWNNFREAHFPYEDDARSRPWLNVTHPESRINF